MIRVAVIGDTFLDVDWTGTVDRVSPDAPVPVMEADGERHRAGGAGLAAQLATAEGAEVSFVTALGADDEGALLRVGLEAAGVTVLDLGLHGATPVKLRVRAAGQSLVRVDRNCSPVAAVGSWPDAATAAIDDADAVLVSDYGRGMAGVPVLAALLHSVRDRVPVVWDPHAKGPRPLPGLDLLTPNLAEATRLVDAVGRGRGRGGESGGELPAVIRAAEMARTLCRQFDSAVAVTAGEAGAALAEPGGEPMVVPVEPVNGDPCGAGDRFAATLVAERARGRPRQQAVRWAVDAARRHVAGDLGGLGDPARGGDRVVADGSSDPAGPDADRDDSLVSGALNDRADGDTDGRDGAGRGAASRRRSTGPAERLTIAAARDSAGASGGDDGDDRDGGSDLPGRAVANSAIAIGGDVDRDGRNGQDGQSAAVALAEATRAAGRTVVVAGGCFDVLHAGHIRLLEAARCMGDRLIVCLNGDLSVRRLKGPRRPANRLADRELVLRSLGCVDEVEVFEEDTPSEALRRLRPHLFVKGADHAGERLPEHDVMAEWGGQIVFVPLVEGRSTTRILHHVAAAVG